MKNKHLFIGIDISKLTFDAAVIELDAIANIQHNTFSNNKKGFAEMLKWIASIHGRYKQENWVFCFEQTGVYAFHLCCFLEDNGLDYCYESALKIHRSLGTIKRLKSDKADSCDIARYLYQKREELDFYKMPSRAIQQLKILISMRRRMVKQKQGMTISSGEIVAFSDKETAKLVKIGSQSIILQLDKQIDKIEAEIEKLLKTDDQLSEKAMLVSSVIGIGPIITAYVIARTNGFANFKSAREFSSYCGSAPFERSSGTSIKRSVHISQAADKELKALLTNGAYAAIRYDAEIRAYYNRKIKEGKSEFCVINAIRNKLIYRMFSVVKRGTPFLKTANYC